MTQPSMDARWQPPSLGLRAGGRLLTFERPLIMGVVNVTPNSFSQGHTTDVAAAVAHGLALVRAGADILDIGGEATNPRAAPVTAEEELARVLPVIESLMARCDAVLSIDTTKAAVARAAVAAGATMVNDVSGGRFDPDMLGTMAELAAAGRAAYVAGHLRGQSISEVFAAETQAQPGDWRQVVDELAAQVAALPPSLRQVTLVDPCLGFGKGAGPLNLQLLRCGRELTAATGCPALIGPSRKRFLRQAAGLASEGAPSSAAAAAAALAAAAFAAAGLDATALAAALDAATVGACLAAVAGGASVLRVHNVALLRPALTVYIRD